MGDAMENHDGVLWETELRLGLPGGGGGGDRRILLPPSASGKRGFSETVDLKLNLGPKEANLEEDKAGDVKDKDNLSFSAKPPSKAQVVGWPPVRSFRRNATAVQKRSGGEEEQAEKGSSAVCGAALVKVSMDGAPYLRKVDLKTFKSYQQLSDALGKMFSSFTNAGECDPQGMQDFMNESKLMDLLNSTDYVPTYEDKDGDWMLVGDVPWEMFVESCKRLRIMKSTEARGLAPRAIEKCKTRG